MFLGQRNCVNAVIGIDHVIIFPQQYLSEITKRFYFIVNNEYLSFCSRCGIDFGLRLLVKRLYSARGASIHSLPLLRDMFADYPAYFLQIYGFYEIVSDAQRPRFIL